MLRLKEVRNGHQKAIAANAKRSTGPRSVVGKSSSSRNNYRVGLSCQLLMKRATAAKVEAITLLVDEGTSKQNVTTAAEFVEGSSSCYGSARFGAR
jgi:hypothetical protein